MIRSRSGPPCLVCVLLLVAGCQDGGPTPEDAGRVSTRPDGGREDAGRPDGGARPVDAGPPDAGPLDAGPLDAGVPDGGPPDAGPCPGGCFVLFRCYAPGEENPLNACERCDPTFAETAFSPVTGERCDDGQACTTDDVCTDGVCGGGPVDCDDGVACNGAEFCEESTGTCVPGVSPCRTGAVCDEDADECVCAMDLTYCAPAGCVDTTSDPSHCDVCGRVCPAATGEVATCDDGVCETTCQAGFDDCDPMVAGCETNTDTSAANCGGCGIPCAGACAGGVCSPNLTPGSLGTITRRGWSVRCRSWSGDLCTHAQVRPECTTCSTYRDCGVWHDLTPFNTASARAAPVFCDLATLDSRVTQTRNGGTSTSPRACGWNSRTHPLCEVARASLALAGSTGLVGGLLANESYCSVSNLLQIECDGW